MGWPSPRIEFLTIPEGRSLPLKAGSDKKRLFPFLDLWRHDLAGEYGIEFVSIPPN
jgi:hypothetical protein